MSNTPKTKRRLIQGYGRYPEWMSRTSYQSTYGVHLPLVHINVLVFILSELLTVINNKYLLNWFANRSILFKSTSEYIDKYLVRSHCNDQSIYLSFIRIANNMIKKKIIK